MREIMDATKAWETAVWMCFDNGYSAGLTPEFMLADLKKEVAGTELGCMDYTLDQLMEQWKEDRGLV